MHDGKHSCLLLASDLGVPYGHRPLEPVNTNKLLVSNGIVLTSMSYLDPATSP